jgi:DNA-binding MarR family transcriptional regulator
MRREDLERMADGISSLRAEILVRRRDANGLLPADQGTEMLALRAIGGNGPLRMTDLARELGLSVATASRTVDALEAEGLVERRRDPVDGRAVQVVMTEAGRREDEVHYERTIRALGELMDELSEDERRELAAALQTVNRLLVERAR